MSRLPLWLCAALVCAMAASTHAVYVNHSDTSDWVSATRLDGTDTLVFISKKYVYVLDSNLTLQSKLRIPSAYRPASAQVWSIDPGTQAPVLILVPEGSNTLYQVVAYGSWSPTHTVQLGASDNWTHMFRKGVEDIYVVVGKKHAVAVQVGFWPNAGSPVSLDAFNTNAHFHATRVSAAGYAPANNKAFYVSRTDGHVSQVMTFDFGGDTIVSTPPTSVTMLPLEAPFVMESPVGSYSTSTSEFVWGIGGPQGGVLFEFLSGPQRLINMDIHFPSAGYKWSPAYAVHGDVSRIPVGVVTFAGDNHGFTMYDLEMDTGAYPNHQTVHGYANPEVATMLVAGYNVYIGSRQDGGVAVLSLRVISKRSVAQREGREPLMREARRHAPADVQQEEEVVEQPTSDLWGRNVTGQCLSACSCNPNAVCGPGAACMGGENCVGDRATRLFNCCSYNPY